MIAAIPPLPVHAQSAPPAAQAVNTTAGHDVVMRAHVAPSCRMSNVAPQIVLSGTTDDGQVVATSVSGQGGFTVDCNTPYAVGLQRSTVYSASSQQNVGQKTAAIRGYGAAPHTAPRLETAGVTDRDLEIVVKVAGIEGQLESHCVMAEAGANGFICNALAGPDDVRQPLPRTTANMIVTGAVSKSVSASSTAADSAVLPEARQDPGTQNPAAIDAAERTLIERALATSGRHLTADRLTVSLSPRH